MTRVIQRIGPLFPAVATAGASVCVSSLLLATGPQTLGPPPVVPPLTSEAGRIVASLSPPAHKLSAGLSRVARSADGRSLSSQARRPAASTPAARHPSQPGGESGPSSPTPPSPPSPPSAPTVTPPAPTPAPPAKVIKASTANAKPGWGHGDPNHVHTGPRGQASKGPKSQVPDTGTAAPKPKPAKTHPGSAQDDTKKSTSPPPGKASNDRKDQGTPTGAVPPPAAPDERGSAPGKEKKSTGR
jgi:hypothetical protein